MTQKRSKTNRESKMSESLRKKAKKAVSCTKVCCLDTLFFEAGVILGKLRGLVERK